MTRFPLILAGATLAIAAAACGSDAPAGPAAAVGCCANGALRVVNAFTTPVSVLIDGTVAASGLAAGAIDTVAAAAGNHAVVLQPSTGASAAQLVTTAAGALNTIAAVRAANGSISAEVLDDTGSVVPSGATKVRVLHLASTAGTLQVYRTQPDYQQPIAWQFPFTYQASFDDLSAPFYQSTVGTWDIRVWQTPADASGWALAPVRVVVALASGEKRTVVILDDPAGGVRVQVM
ncbi:MAG TPA: DUF4397 domain-containing protein [Gemmatimonadaceae bacterium]|nr:DUF4397 domain-containing protein [Gemmatimonadaceae bacterium]